MNNKTRDYFAYGSNMDTEQMLRRCPDAEFNGIGVLRNYKFALDEEGLATVVPCEGKEVQGVIWRISETDERSLDRYEGVSVGCYTKETLKVRPEGYFSKFPMLTYVSARGSNDGKRRDGYIERIVTAAEKHGFDNSYLGMLKDIWVGYANEDVRLNQEQIERCMESSREIIERVTKKECEKTPGFENMSAEEKEKLHDETYRKVSSTICIDFKGCV